MIIAETAEVINAEYPIQNLFINNDLSGIVNNCEHNVKSLTMGQIIIDTMATVD